MDCLQWVHRVIFGWWPGLVIGMVKGQELYGSDHDEQGQI